MREVIKEIFDKGSFFEVQEEFAQNAICWFCQIGRICCWNRCQSAKILAGVLDIDSSDKISRFVRFCDCFNIPIINLVDTPGYLPGKEQESGGIIRHGAKVLYAFAEANCSKNFSDFEKGIWWSLYCFGFKRIGL
jgi:acetyl-CoA carboxylase carboxyltransferase component